MNFFPVDKTPSGSSVDVLKAFRSVTQPLRAEEDALMAATINDIDLEETKARIEAGGNTDVIEAKRRIQQQNEVGLEALLESQFKQDALPETTASMIANEDRKMQTWNQTGDHLYLEAAMSLNDPTIDADLARFLTNLQIGEEVLQEAMQEVEGDTGVGGYIWDFVDRYFLRAMVIGGFEDITGRSIRGGREHLENALLADPQQYEAWIRGQVEGIRQEGFFTGDNVFALQEEFGRFQNAGQDPLAGVWAALGVVDVLPIAGVIGKAAKAGTRVRRAKMVGGPQAADEVYETMLKAEGASPSPRTVNDGMPESHNVLPDPDGGASLHRTARIRDENIINKEINHLNSKSTFGRGLDSDEVVQAADNLIETLRKTTNNPLVNIHRPVRRDTTGGFVWNVRLGTVKTGRPYATEQAAQRAINRSGVKDDFPTAKPVPYDPEDPSKGFYIDIERRMDVDPYVDELSHKAALDPIRQIVARFAGSKGATEAENLQTLAVMAEGATSSLAGGQGATELVRAVQRLPAKSQDAVSRIFNDLRDGKDAGMRNAYNEMEFKTKFKEYHPDGWDATDADYAGFIAIQQLSDAAYMMRAHLRMQKYVRNDYYAVVFPDGTRVPGKQFGGQTDELIYDLGDKTPRYQKDLRKNTVIWELDRELDSGIRFVAKPAEVKTLDHTDVLGYNAGGRRLNPSANYFVLVNPDNPRAFLTTVTAEDAEVAIQQIGRIQDAIRQQGGAERVTKGGPIDEVIRANNDWNTELQTVEDFIRFADEKKIDLTSGRVVSKARDGEIRTGETRDGFSETWDEYVSFGMTRQDEVLTQFGGGETRNYDAVSAIFDDFGSITHQFAWNDYTQTALHSWLKAARKTGSGWDVGPEVDPRRAFENAALKENTNPAARELGLQRNIINRRLGIKSEAFRAMESYGAAVQEWVFGKTRGRVELSRDPIKGASQRLLNFGFVSAFGLGNISQFFVQGYHALTIAALTQNSVTSFGSGMKAITMTPALRLALFAPDSAAEALAVKRLAKAMSQTEDSVKELIDYIRTSGRDIIDGTAMEAGTGQQFGLRGWKGESYLPSSLRDVQRKIGQGWRGAMKAGLTPFREGERMARLTGITTAVLEYQSKFPGKAISTAHARRWISHREQTLSFRMTNANRALMQEGFGKLPTQWFTYTLRTFENVLMGRDFTTGERARLAAALFPAFGLTGMGAASATDWLAEKVGAEPAGQLYTFIKYGIVDSLLETTGVELAIADRLAPITLIQDVYSNIDGQKSAWEVALGPSGDIAGGVVEQVMNVVGDIYAGTPVSLTEDTIRVARQWTGVDNVAKAIGIWNTGLYRSRTGRQLPFELTASDAIGQLFGFSPREVSEYYNEKQWQYTNGDKVRSLTSEFRNEFSRAMEMINEGDTERGTQLLKEIQIKIQISGLSPIDQATVRRGLKVTTSEELYRMIVERTKRGDYYAGERIEESFDFIGTN